MGIYSLRVTLVLGLLVGMLPILNAGAHSIDDPIFERTWARSDLPVAQGRVDRTWMWGPQGYSEAFLEPYADAPGGERLVQYTDKSRMEDNSYRADPPWDVTNGLIAKELITGEMQTGDNSFEQLEPAKIQVAGDPHPDTPTYSSFNHVLDYEPIPTDWTIIQTIDQNGAVSVDESLSHYGVTAANHVSDTNHTVASVFWDFMNSSGEVFEAGGYRHDKLFENPFFAVGLPITEAYWVHVPVAGEWQDVLTQCFERRCLTFTPGNDDGWHVEAANIGQHYYEWRYEETPDPAPIPPPSDDLGELNVYYFDVGQADATLLDGPDFNILIDAGHWQRNDIVAYIQSVGVSEIDLLILTHPHADHIGQVPQVMSNFPVNEVWMTGWEHTSQTFGNALDAVIASDAGYHEPRAGETESIGSAIVEVVHPVEPLSDIHDNLGVRVSFGDVRFLFTGDAEVEHETQMIARGEPLQAQILQLGHHGSSTSTSNSFLNAVNPQVAIYSAGANNSYGHPHDEVVTRILDRGIDLYGTDVNGTIRVQTDGATYAVHVDQVGDIQPPIVAPPPAPSPKPEPPPDDPPSECVNLNTASHQDLQKIIHIGPARATQIIELRPFNSVDSLTRVDGIAAGGSRLADIKAQGLACV